MIARSARSLTWFLAACLAAFCAAAPLAAEEWGDLTIRFVYDGEPAKAPAGPVPVLVNDKDRGVANVVVWIESQRGAEFPVHPSYERTAKDSVTLRIKDQHFEPQVLPARTTQTLALDNQDAAGATVKSELLPGPGFTIVVPGKTKLDPAAKFPAGEQPPVPVVCPEVAAFAWLLVRDGPYMAVSDKSGKLTIRNLPAGERTFVVWHERIGFLKQATIGGEQRTLKKGRLDRRIEPGPNDLGEILLKPAAFE